MTHSYDINHKVIRVDDKVYADNAALAGNTATFKGFSQNRVGIVFAQLEFILDDGSKVDGELPTAMLCRKWVQS